jgi:hypothetical protein
MKKNEAKFQTVIDKNTFYFYNHDFQQKYESHINSLTETLLILKNQVETEGLQKSTFESLLTYKENGLRALLALTGFANESLKRLITVVRVSDDKELCQLLLKSEWADDTNTEVKEWGDAKINNLLKTNPFFRTGIVNLFFEGASIPYLSRLLPLFELKKLSITKLSFDKNAMIDTLVRYKEKGSYSGKADNNPERSLIATWLEALNIPFEKGDLTELFENEPIAKRTMDFIIPNKANPQVIIESSFVVTTSSAQGDKAKTEGNIKILIGKYYPKAKFIGFIDGIGWYVRKGDLNRLVDAFDEVFTFHPTEMERFKLFIQKEIVI